MSPLGTAFRLGCPGGEDGKAIFLPNLSQTNTILNLGEDGAIGSGLVKTSWAFISLKLFSPPFFSSGSVESHRYSTENESDNNF